MTSDPLELENQVQDQIKEEESTVEEVDQSRIGSSPEVMPGLRGLKIMCQIISRRRNWKKRMKTHPRLDQIHKRWLMKQSQKSFLHRLKDSHRYITNQTRD